MFNSLAYLNKDALMDSFFSVELCKLIGLYTLSKIRYLYGYKDIGLDRDDGLAIKIRKNNQKLARLKKNTIQGSCAKFHFI